MSDAVIHARILSYAGQAYSPWAGSGRRQYTERETSTGDKTFACGKTLATEHAVTPWCWVVLKSRKSRERKLVTCEDCRARLLAMGYLEQLVAL